MIVHFPVLTGTSSLFGTIEKKNLFHITSHQLHFNMQCKIKLFGWKWAFKRLHTWWMPQSL